MNQAVGNPPVVVSLPGVVVQPDEPTQMAINFDTLMSTAAAWNLPPQPTSPAPPAQAPAQKAATEGMSATEMEDHGASKAEVRSLLQKLQIETMHGMVKDVAARYGDKVTASRFLYLTNKQAAEIRAENMHKVRGELNLKSPSLVIRLMPCQLGGEWWRAFKYFPHRFPEKRTPETAEEGEVTEHQLLLLAKEVLLPLALSAKALVLGQEACSLTAAFLKVCGPIQHEFRERGKDCPFSVLVLCRAPFFDQVARDDSSVVSNFRRASARWTRKAQCMAEALDRRYGNDPAYWPRLDLAPGQYSIIMFECLDHNGAIGEKAFYGFQHHFIASLMDSVPVLGLQTYGTERMNFLPTMQDHVGRGMPLFLIDSRRRRDLSSTRVEETDTELRRLSEALHKAGVADWYSTSTLAYVKSAIDRRRRCMIKGEDNSDKEQRDMWIWQAILQKRREWAAKQAESSTRPRSAENSKAAGQEKRRRFGKKGASTTVMDLKDTINITEEQQLIMGTNIVMAYTGREFEWEMTERHKRFKDAIACIQQTQTWNDFRDMVEKQWMAIRGCAFHLSKGLLKFVEEHPWAELRDEGERPSYKWRMGRYRIVVNPDEVPNMSEKSAFEDAKGCLLKLFDKEFSISSGIDENRLTTRAFTSEDDKWMAVYEVLKSDDVATGSLHDLRDCKRKLMQMSHMDYLPTDNSLEALVLLRRAWTLVDLYKHRSARYGMIAKSFYFLLLILEVVIIVVVTLRSATDEWLKPLHTAILDDVKLSSYILFGIALLSSAISGYTSLISPNRKYMRLKSAAMKLESEIWKFRTRMGVYRLKDAALVGDLAADRESEAIFADNVLAIEEGIRQTAGMGRTEFYSVATTVPDTLSNPDLDASNSRLRRWRQMLTSSLATHTHHHQYNMGCKAMKQGGNNHHSPETSDRYVQIRLIPSRDLVQKKIPRLSRLYCALQAVILVSSTLSAALAAVGDGNMTAIIAAITGCVAAWQEFTGVEMKLDKLSEVAQKLDDLVLWWQALPDEDKRAIKNCEDLVLEAEFQIVRQMTVASSNAAVQQKQKQKADGELKETKTAS